MIDEVREWQGKYYRVISNEMYDEHMNDGESFFECAWLDDQYSPREYTFNVPTIDLLQDREVTEEEMVLWMLTR